MKQEDLIHRINKVNNSILELQASASDLQAQLWQLRIELEKVARELCEAT